jgi:L-ascorbate 6-phosphate lactonase
MSRLLEQIDRTHTATPTLWWLGHGGFAIKYADLTFYVNPCLTSPAGRARIVEPPLAPRSIENADLILCTDADPRHLDGGTLIPMLEFSPRAKVVLPKSAADHARSLGIGFDRMTATDSGLRVEYFRDSLYGRVHSVPSAQPGLDWTLEGGYPYLGYLIRFEGVTIYHAGGTVLYPDLAHRLKPFNVTVALLPIGKGNLDAAAAAQLSEEIGASWLVPMHYGVFDDSPHLDGFIEHILGHRPFQRFKIFEIGEGWTVPPESE